MNNKTMIKLISFTFLLFSAISNAQDYKFIERSKNLDSETSTLEFTNELVKFSNVELRLYKTRGITNQKMFKAVYVPAALKNEDIENYNVSDADKANYCTFLFYVDSATKYRLVEMTAPQGTIVPIWQKFYNANSDRLNEPDKNIQANIYKEGIIATIHNL